MSSIVFVSADYDGLELRTIAQSCIKLVGFSKMAEVLNIPRDVHTDFAASMVGLTYEQADALKISKDKEFDNQRQTAKVANFGFGGGLGAEKFVLFARKSYNVRLTVERARELKQQWLGRWTEMPHFFAHNSALVKNGGTLEQLFTGRKRGGLHFCNACNSWFQGLGADATGNAAFLIQRACYTQVACAACEGAANGCEWCRPCHGPGISALYGSRMVNYVHDDFILETPEQWCHEVGHELVRWMKIGAAPFLPDVPASAKPVAMHYWSKDAEAVYKDGRLIPWPEAA